MKQKYRLFIGFTNGEEKLSKAYRQYENSTQDLVEVMSHKEVAYVEKLKVGMHTFSTRFTYKDTNKDLVKEILDKG